MTPEQETAIAAANLAANFYFRSKPWIKPQEHDDLRQESVIAALRAIDRFRPDAGASLKTWCSRAAAWKLSELAMTHAKRTAKRGILAHLDDGNAPPQLDRGPQIVDSKIDAEAVLLTCTDRQASIIRAVGEGRHIPDVAERIGSNTQAVAETLSYARRKCAARFPELACRYGAS